MRIDRLLATLDDEQRAAVVEPPGRLVIAAGAGTGKTRTVAARIAHHVSAGVVNGAGVLAVTHTNRAAGELRARLDSFGMAGLEQVAVRTFHGAARGQLAAVASALGHEPWQVMSDAPQTVELNCRAVGIDPSLAGAVLREIDWAKVSLVRPDAYVTSAGGRRLPRGLTPAMVARAYGRYQDSLRKRNVLDTTDLLLAAAHQVESDERVAQLVRRHAQFVVVDEFQDTDPAQARLLSAWAPDDASDLTVVGDLRQAIYTWKGSDPQLLAGFATDPRARVRRLSTNYRSASALVDVANRLDEGAAGGTPPAMRGPLRPAAVAADGAASVFVAADERSERRWVCAQVARTLAAGARPDEVAVLVRTQREAREVAQELAAAGVPTSCPIGSGFFARPEVEAACASLRSALSDPAGDAHAVSGASALREVLADAGHDRSRAPDPDSPMRETWGGREGLLRWVEQLPSAEMLGGWDLLEHVDRCRDGGYWAPDGSVNVLTIHAAKGLEFDVVVSMGWDRGPAPDCAEDRRLAYVAATRARRELFVTAARTRRSHDRVPSSSLRASGLLVAT